MKPVRLELKFDTKNSVSKEEINNQMKEFVISLVERNKNKVGYDLDEFKPGNLLKVNIVDKNSGEFIDSFEYNIV